MKEFEKWWREENKYNYECYTGIGSKSWRAALEWVLQTYNNYLYDSRFFDESFIIEKIEKELNGST